MTGVAPSPVGTATKYETEVSGSDIVLALPAGAATGMTIVAGIRTNSSSTAANYSCSGFAPRGHAFIPNDAAGRVLSLFTHYIADISAEPASYTFVNAGGTTGRRVGVMQLFSGVDSVSPVAGNDPGWNAAGKPTILLNSFAVDTSNDCLLIYAWGNEITSGNATAPTSVPGTMLALAASRATADATRSVLWMGYEPIAATTAGPESLTWTSSSGEAASGFVLRGLATPSVPVQKFSSVSQFLSTKGATAIHRAPAGYTQSCIDTLQKASVQGFSAFEMSVGFSQDLKPFLSGYQYLDPLVLNAATTTLDPLTMTWASISSTYQNISGPSPQPLALLADALAATVDAGLGIALVDPKYGFATLARVNAMLDVCDAHGGPSKILIKFDNETTNTVLTTAAHARGYLCINYWGSDTANLALQQANWDVLGGLYSAGSTMWDALKSYGKKTWAAIVPNQAALNQAVIDTAADFYMVQSLAIQPVGPSAPDPSTYASKTSRDLEIAWLRKVSGSSATASVSDLRYAVYGASEYAYWAAKSGLSAGSLSDHRLAAMKADTGATGGSLADVSRAYWAKNG